MPYWPKAEQTRRAMSPQRVRASLLLLLSCCLLAVSGRDKREAGGVLAPAQASVRGSSGRFVGPERHACSWQLLQPAPEPAARSSELEVRCRGPEGARQQCAYRGEPERCAAYAARPAHYWKQVLGALRRKRRPCLDPAPLQARLCAGKQGRGAELRLVPHWSPPTAAGFPGELKPRAGSRGLARSLAPRLAAWVPHPRPSAKLPGETQAGSKRKVASADKDEERPPGTGPDRDGLDDNAKLTENYCTEKWHSLCNFFVNFWNG
ncbi:fibroblast growth factor-binding protein 3 [Erinaceus europaeus]|uniref:Fibroblast growth factor-binding protein 3 n=1 Tax=Erinaceus europaeus TaxID=9365 RepID=A0A1S2ZBK2_ERIEU|nr:fibroblast growth factor-binding protein 3 [Erinaceus europaeus]